MNHVQILAFLNKEARFRNAYQCNGCHCCGECLFQEKCYVYDVQEIYGPPNPEVCIKRGGLDCSGNYILSQLM